jgi:N-acetylglucosaminyl-diphospho-decaprenol L-rhamnosyltransferase
MQDSIKEVSIVIVTFNSENVIKQCLDSINPSIKTYIIDNASSDNSCKIIEDTITGDQLKWSGNKLVLIKNKTNIGFGRANNIALDMINTKYALLLNPDTKLEDNSIEMLLAAAEKYLSAAIIAPNLYYENGTLQQSYKADIFKRERLKTKYYPPEGDICADCLSGAVMLLRTKYFENIGYFDPNIFLFYEDDDLCLKVKENGYSMILTPSAKVMHLMGKSSPASTRNIYKKNFHLAYSRLYLEQKYRSKKKATFKSCIDMFLYLIKTTCYTIILKKKKAVAYGGRMMGSLFYLIEIKL